ncbi:hydrophobin family protein [Aspergillus undulatus]|uniref:hydrophobin family protein n=1 Tax=Aspergillus undulatus TaxID=1810928 RepID=UPI003CCCA689
MKFAAALSIVALAGSALATAVPTTNEQELTAMVYDAARQIDAANAQKRDTSECIAPLLCCGTLTTPLESTVDPILLGLGIDAAEIVGSIGLLCHAYDDSCDSEPQCCTEVNLLGGTLAVGCSPLEHHGHH